MKLVGKVIESKYQFIQTLGVGGMGSVYLAKDLKLGTFWAIKVIKKNNNINILAEFNVLKKLDYPALTRITDISDDDTYIYIVMDFVDGRNLSSILKERGGFSETEVVDYSKQMCDVLQYLHNQKPNPIIHKDIKPANIMINKEGRLKLIDFGIAKEGNEQWDDNLLLATAGYVSPEIINDARNISPQSDIYALGATMYHLLTGIKPKKNEFPLPLLRTINSEFSEAMEYIVAKATQVDLTLRYQNAEEFRKDLDNIGKLGDEYVQRVKGRKRKIMVSCCTFLLSGIIALNGWKGYGAELEKKFHSFISKGIEARNNMDYKEALNQFDKAEEYLSNEKEGYYESAKTYLVMGANDECIRYLNNLMDQKKPLKEDNYINYLLGKAYLYKVNYEKANEYFKKVTDKKEVGEDFPYLMEISKQFISPEDVNVEKFQESLNKFEKFIDDNKEDKAFAVASYLALADMYTYGADILSNAFDREVDVVLKAKKISVNDYGVLDKLATAYREKARNIRFSNKVEYEHYLKEALSLYNECLDIQSSIDVYLNIGDIYVELSNYESAKNAYEKIIEINKEHYLGYMKLSSLSFTMGNKEEAKEYLKKTEECSNLSPNDPQYLYLKKNLE